MGQKHNRAQKDIVEKKPTWAWAVAEGLSPIHEHGAMSTHVVRIHRATIRESVCFCFTLVIILLGVHLGVVPFRINMKNWDYFMNQCGLSSDAISRIAGGRRTEYCNVPGRAYLEAGHAQPRRGSVVDIYKTD